MGKEATPPEAVTLSAHFRDPKDAELIRRVAKRVRMSPSAFLRDAGLAFAARIEATCPTCGARHPKPKKVSKSAKSEAAAA